MKEAGCRNWVDKYSDMNEFTVDDKQHVFDYTINSVKRQSFMGITGVEGLDMILGVSKTTHFPPEASVESQHLSKTL